MKKKNNLFWDIGGKFLKKQNISEGTLMGFPCLRADKAFIAMADHRTGDLIVKLPGDLVQELIQEGIGQPFAPAGRTFKEWVRIERRDRQLWEKLMEEAENFTTVGC